MNERKRTCVGLIAVNQTRNLFSTNMTCETVVFIICVSPKLPLENSAMHLQNPVMQPLHFLTRVVTDV